YRDLVLGRLDAVLLDLPMAEYYARGNRALAYAGAATGKGTYAIAFRKDEAALAAQFDAAIERLIRSGELRRIHEKWHLWNDDQRALGDIREGAADAASATGGRAASGAGEGVVNPASATANGAGAGGAD